MYRTSGFFGAVVAALLASGFAAAQELIITEIAALNRRGLTDEDERHPDWIEIFNPGDAAVALGGWSLTDRPTEPRRWIFPDGVELGPGKFLVVFASENDRRDPDSELHTNFELLSTGEFLGLVAPGGDLVSFFAPGFPEQVPDVSYGFAMDTSGRVLLETGAEARFLVPENDDLGLSWTEPDFDDSGWSSGPTGIGYDTKEPPTYRDLIRTDVGALMEDASATIYVRVSFDGPAALGGNVRLRVMYEDGFVAYLNGVEVARRNTTSAVRYNSRASIRRSEDDAVMFEEIPLPQDAPLRSGRNVLAFHGLNDTSRSPDFLLVPELDLMRVDAVHTDRPLYFEVPSPARPNTGGHPAVAEAPAFSLAGGAYTEVQALELTTPSGEEEIRYTLDGSIPSRSSELYTGPITIDGTTMVSARGFRDDRVPSPAAIQSYVLVHPNLAQASSNLPLMIIDTFRRVPQPDPYFPAFFATIDNEGGRNSLADTFAQSGAGGIRTHGSSSLGFEKKNFRLETRDELGDDLDVPLLGLPAESDWVLHGPYSDKSLMRNALSYRWSNEIGWSAPRTRFFELYINMRGDPQVLPQHYWGVYLLVERIKRSPDRVDIERLLPSHDREPEITGGYIFKNDRADPGDAGFSTGRYTFRYVEPKEREITQAQRAYVNTWFRQFESALYGPNFKDPDEGYAKYIDIPSFIDHHIVVETCKQIDGYRLSTYMYKDRGGKLFMGPAWDYNLSLGNADYLGGWQPQGWYYTQVGGQDYPWYQRLFQDEAFYDKYRDRWFELRSALFATQRLQSTIDDYANLLRAAQTRNFQRWRILGIRIWPNWFIARTWDEEIQWMRNDWLAPRLAWMDSQLTRPPVFSHPGGPVSEGFLVEIRSPGGGDVFYTLDGSDPMAANGTVAPAAVRYTEPISIERNVKIIARARIGNSVWSGTAEATFVTEVIPLVLTEIMYNPPDDPEGNFSSTYFEFLEFLNVGNEPIELSGMRLVDRLRFDFTGSAVATLDPGEYVVVVQNEEAFLSRYGSDGIKIAGTFAGILSNRSQLIDLRGPLDEPLVHVTYEDSWYPSTDGEGYSLVLSDPYGPRELWGEPSSWRASLEIGGSPGRADGPVTRRGFQRPGDINQDGRLNITDAVGILKHLFTGSPELPCASAAGNLELTDGDGDGELTLSDGVRVLRYLFLADEPPVLGAECIAIASCPDACGSN